MASFALFIHRLFMSVETLGEGKESSLGIKGIFDENVTSKVKSVASIFIALIPSRPFRQMLAIFSGVEF